VAGAPVETSCLVPQGFRISDTGIERINWRGEWVQISPTPVVISETSRRLEDGREQLTVKWLDPRTRNWLSATAGREVFSSKTNIVSLSSIGLAVTSTTASGLVDYLHQYLAVNAAPTPRRDAVGKCGWISNERFALGRETICAVGADPVTFTADGSGETGFVEALHESGSFEEWRKLTGQVVTSYSIPATVLYAALASPLLKPLGVQNFFVHLAGDSSKGKSTSLAFGMSAWGDPSEGRLVRMWNSTAVGVERLAALSSDIGLALDEAQTAEDEFLSKILYSYSSGIGKNRGAKTGTQATPTWRSICLSSGEKGLESGTPYRGAGVRVLTLFGRPFGDNGKLAAEVGQFVTANHGFAGPRMVRALINRRAEWPKIRQQYKDAVERWTKTLTGDTSRRRAQFIAVLEVAAVLAHEVLDLPGDGREVLGAAMTSLASPPAEETFARSAFNRLYGYAVANQIGFHGKERKFKNEPVLPNKYLGDWTKTDRIAFFPEVFEEVMKAGKVDPRTALSAMAEKGWVLREADNLRAKVTLPDGNRLRMVVIALRSGVDGGDPGDFNGESAAPPTPAPPPSPDSDTPDSGNSGADSGGNCDGTINDSEEVPF
jgi:putative DNA primase/helicase